MNTVTKGEWAADFGPVRAFVRMGPHLAFLAREARKKAVSYRGFKVGAAALAATDLGEIRIFEGANYKPSREVATICAEKNVLQKVEAEKFDRIVALVISGPLQPDKHSGLELPTLHPCGDCRDLLVDAPQIKNDTFIMPVHPTQDTYELYSRRELQVIHAAADREEAPEEFMDYTDTQFRLWERGKTDFEALFSGPLPDQLERLSLFQLARLAVTDQLRTLMI